MVRDECRCIYYIERQEDIVQEDVRDVEWEESRRKSKGVFVPAEGEGVATTVCFRNGWSMLTMHEQGRARDKTPTRLHVYPLLTH